MAEIVAGADNPEHAIQLAETVESDSSSQVSENQNCAPGQNRDIYHSKVVPLYNAAVNGNWKEAEHLLMADPQLATTAITVEGETALHIATGARQVNFVKKLIEFMLPEPESLALQDRNGNTAFFVAAAAGCIEIANILWWRIPFLPEIRGHQGLTPLNMAVLLGKKEMATFLYYLGLDTSYLTSRDQTRLFFDSITSDLYDLAFKLLERTPELALARYGDLGELNGDTMRNINGDTALHMLARKPASMFNQEIKFTRNQESTSTPALQLLNRLWEVAKRKSENIIALITRPSNLLFDAARLGNSRFLAVLIGSYPHLVYELDDEGRTIFHVAILNRQLSVFNLINKIGFSKEIIATYVDKMGNSMLHLAALYQGNSPESALSSAALEMQQELIIFQEVKKLVQPALTGAKNDGGLTPDELFDRDHAGLQQSGVKWMNKTANSCSVVATLIATVVFAAAFTVPGATDDKTGTPLLLKKTLFRVFAISDAIALSSSSFSILMFLSILSSGYTKSQFLRSLPLKLMIGLLALLISIIFMMITFSSTYFLLYQDRSYTIPTLTAVFVSIPISLFVLLQYPLLRDIFYLTHRSGVLCK